MNKATDKEYERITQEFLEAMDRVTAPVEDYRAALRDARSQIDGALTASEEIDGKED